MLYRFSQAVIFASWVTIIVMNHRLITISFALALLASALPLQSLAVSDQKHPDVLAVKVRVSANGTFELRDLYGVRVSPTIKSEVIEARDRKYGYGGETIVVMLPGW